MPTLKHPPNNGVDSETPRLPHTYLKVLGTRTHLVALAVVAILAAIGLLIVRWRRSRSHVLRFPGVPLASDIKHNPTQAGYLFASPHGKRGSAVLSIGARDWQRLDPRSEAREGRRQPHEVRAAGSFVSSQFRPLGKLPTMNGKDGEFGEDHHPGSALASRAVSTTDPGHHHGPSPSSPSTVTIIGRTRPSSQDSSIPNRYSSDGSDGQRSKGKGKGPMEGHSDRVEGFHRVALYGQTETRNTLFDSPIYAHPSRNAPFSPMDFATPRQFSRPLPPPPLIPPTINAPVFPFENRRTSYAVSIPPELDMSFIHQPNPEYSSCSTSAEVLSSSPRIATSIPRRRSYTKTVPIGIPIPTTASASSSTETVSSRASTFFPSSYPPTSPFLPPPPPGHEDTPSPSPPPPAYVFVGGPGGPGVFLSQQEIDVQGEIISVMDDAGHGWKRHTRVYGGGSCLACVAAQGRGESEGGFYGPTVPLEDRT